jgi:hypothetical protein
MEPSVKRPYLLNEHGYIRSIHRPLPSEMHKWKIHDNYAGGVPDCWYSGPAANIWVEYKWIAKLPKRDTTLIKPNLSAQQLAWLIKMSGHSISCACIIGSPAGGFLLTEKEQWINGIEKHTIISNKEVSKWLTEFCMETRHNGQITKE